MPPSSIIIIKDLIKRDILRWKRKNIGTLGNIRFDVPTSDAAGTWTVTGTAANTLSLGSVVNLTAGAANTLDINTGATINGDLTVTGKITSG